MIDKSTRNTRHAFISYRRLDADDVDKLVKSLEPSHPTWRDTAEIRGGQKWLEEIVWAIDAAYALILVVSSRTEESKEVYAEYFYALGRKVPIIPLLIDETSIPFGMENVNARLWYQNREQALKGLIDDLNYYRHRASVVEPADDVQTYLRALQFNYLMAVGNYTPMAGVARLRSDHKSRRPNAVVMGTEFSLRRSSPLHTDKKVSEEVRSYEYLLPALHQMKRVLMLGEPGIGKTTTLFKFADALRQRALQDTTAPVPVIVPLREWRGDSTWKELVCQHLGGLAHRYEELLAHHRLYLLLDALNEIPRDQYREKKLRALRQTLGNMKQAVVTCRELDYRDETLRLGDLDTVSIHPLAPERVLDFLRRYLIDIHGEEKGAAEADDLFWQIAGGAELKAIWDKWRQAGANLNLFFSALDIPRESPNVYSSTGSRDDEVWRRVAKSTANLFHLAVNPYLLWMFLNIYLEKGTVPSNRGALFDEFVFQLFRREGLNEGETFSAEGDHLSDALGEVAWRLQTQAGGASVEGRDLALTLPRRDAIQIVGTAEQLYRAASANLLEDAEPVSFTHQLLQEYFTARRMLKDISSGHLDARNFWPTDSWWEPSGWEEAAVFAAGMGGEQVIEWLLPVHPEVAALAINRSGVPITDRLKLTLRTTWLPRLTDVDKYPEAAARAAIGRALGSVTLSSGEPLDNRPGVGLTTEGLPDIEWVEILEGNVTLEKVDGKFKVTPFRIARYPVTNIQFQTFVDAADGYRNPEWWKDIEQTAQPNLPRWSEANCPRETVSWYEAVAYCRWLTCKAYFEQGKEFRLPTEWEWQQAATCGNPTKVYPWGSQWDASRCNSEVSHLYRTTAVGMYPHGTWPGGPLEMSGNVWEWCLNKFDVPEDHDAAIIDDGDLRVVRGGSWKYKPWNVCATNRGRRSPVDQVSNIGFRLAQYI